MDNMTMTKKTKKTKKNASAGKWGRAGRAVVRPNRWGPGGEEDNSLGPRTSAVVESFGANGATGESMRKHGM